MNLHLIMAAPLLRQSMQARLEPLPEEVPLDPIDVAALRRLSSRPEPKPAARDEGEEPLRRAA
jgi:hypothetical protein